MNTDPVLWLLEAGAITVVVLGVLLLRQWHCNRQLLARMDLNLLVRGLLARAFVRGDPLAVLPTPVQEFPEVLAQRCGRPRA